MLQAAAAAAAAEAQQEMSAEDSAGSSKAFFRHRRDSTHPYPLNLIAEKEGKEGGGDYRRRVGFFFPSPSSFFFHATYI